VQLAVKDAVGALFVELLTVTSWLCESVAPASSVTVSVTV
jgi:hypothetical protein